MTILLFYLFLALGFEIVDEIDQVEDLRALAHDQWKERASKLGIEISERKAGTDNQE